MENTNASQHACAHENTHMYLPHSRKNAGFTSPPLCMPADITMGQPAPAGKSTYIYT